ncbi:MAG: AraC family transcriptional regulator [Rhodospirillales bacterium]|nr:AraC family transcriptional regulator [Rhodospirillales bacterium]
MSWTTAAVAPGEQVAMWQEVTRHRFAPLEMVAAGRGAFRAAGQACAKGRLRLTRVDAQSHQARQTRATVAAAPAAGFSVKLVLRHSMRVEQFGEDVVLDPGDIALVDVHAPCLLSFPAGADLVAAFVPDEVMRRRLGPRGRPASLRIRADGLGALIGAYIQGLWRIGAQEVGDMDYAMLDHLGTLIGRAARDAVAAPLVDRQHRVTCARILAEIEAGLGDAELSAEQVARRLRISRSHLYAVLAESGMTFSGTLRERRLQAARRCLTSGRFADTRVADIAMRCGYSDAASFTRAYGKRFGQSPVASRNGG